MITLNILNVNNKMYNNYLLGYNELALINQNTEKTKKSVVKVMIIYPKRWQFKRQIISNQIV